MLAFWLAARLLTGAGGLPPGPPTNNVQVVAFSVAERLDTFIIGERVDTLTVAERIDTFTTQERIDTFTIPGFPP